MEREKLIETFRSMHDNAFFISKDCKDSNPAWSNDLLHEACTLSTVISMLENDEFAWKMRNCFPDLVRKDEAEAKND